jgi:Zn-dependent protease
MPGSVKVARLAGIPIGIHPLWLAVVGLITWSLGAGYFPEAVPGISAPAAYALGFASAMLLFASIVLHELGHALTARRYGIRIQEIDLWLLGGVAVMRDGPRHAGEELRFALAGPLVSIAIGGVCALLALLVSLTSLTALQALLEYQALINLLIVGFNLLPAFPLDGGRVARAALWSRMGEKGAATRIAAAVGRGFAFGFIALGTLAVAAGLPGGIWFALIGLFLLLAARAEVEQARLQELFAGRPAQQMISHPAVALPGDITVGQAIRDYFVPLGYTSFPVVDRSGRPLGLLSLSRLNLAGGRRAAIRTAGDLADRDPDLLVAEDDDLADVLARPAFARTGRAIVVDPAGQISGLLSITDVQRAVRATALAAEANGRSQPRDT